jgi:hypothetical protein
VGCRADRAGQPRAGCARRPREGVCEQPATPCREREEDARAGSRASCRDGNARDRALKTLREGRRKEDGGLYLDGHRRGLRGAPIGDSVFFMCGVERERGFGLSRGERGGRFLGLGRHGRFSQCGREIRGRKLEKRPPDCMAAEPSRHAWRLYAARRHEPALLAAALGRRSWAAPKKKRARSGGPRATGPRGGKRGGAGGAQLGRAGRKSGGPAQEKSVEKKEKRREARGKKAVGSQGAEPAHDEREEGGRRLGWAARRGIGPRERGRGFLFIFPILAIIHH